MKSNKFDTWVKEFDEETELKSNQIFEDGNCTEEAAHEHNGYRIRREIDKEILLDLFELSGLLGDTRDINVMTDIKTT